MGFGISLQDILLALDLLEIEDKEHKLFLVQRVQACIEEIYRKEEDISDNREPKTMDGTEDDNRKE